MRTPFFAPVIACFMFALPVLADNVHDQKKGTVVLQHGQARTVSPTKPSYRFTPAQDTQSSVYPAGKKKN